MRKRLRPEQRTLLELMSTGPIPVRVIYCSATDGESPFYYRDDTGRVCTRTAEALIGAGKARLNAKKTELEVV